MNSIGKNKYYSLYIEGLNNDIEAKKQRRFELLNSRFNLITVIENEKFDNAFVVISDLDPIEYVAYFYRIKDMQRHFKLDECNILNADKEEHEHSMFLKSALYNVMKYNRAIKEVDEQIEELENYIIPYEIYKSIIDTHDSLLARYLLDGRHYAFGNGIGSIYIKEKDRNYAKKVINHEASNKEKKRLIANGLIPYKKIDMEKAEAEGRVYEGVKYHIYYYDDTACWVCWGKTKFIKNVILYSFKPTIANNTGQSIYDLQKEIKFDAIPNYKIGFTQMIQLTRRMNPEHSKVYRNNNTINA